jgi:replicative DNA helicase
VTAETGEKSDALMTMSYELDAAVVAAHQLNRNTEGRDDKHPTPADLRNSGDLEQDAHTLIFPYRQSYYLERQKLEDPEKDRIRLATLEKKKNLLEILVSKCRNGACGTVEVFADMPSNHVEDLMR